MLNLKKQKQTPSALEKQLRVLSQVSEQIVGHIDLQEVLKLVLNTLVHQLGFAFSGLFLLNKDSRLTLTEVGMHPVINKIFKAELGKNLFDVSYLINDAASRRCYVVRSVVEKKILASTSLMDFSTAQYIDPTRSVFVQKLTGIKIFVAIPILLRGTSMGVLVVATKQTDLAEKDKDVLQTFANQISIAIFNAQLFSKVQHQVVELTEQAKDLNALHDLSSVAGSSLQKTRVLQALLDYVPSKLGHIGVEGAAVLLATQDPKYIQATAFTQGAMTKPILKILGKKDASAMQSVRAAIDSSRILKAVFSERHPQQFANLTDAFPTIITRHMDTAIARLGGIKSYILYPILDNGKVVGTVLLTLSIPVDQVTHRHTEILQVFVNHLASSLENADLFERLRQQYKMVEHQTLELAVANRRLRTLDRTKSEFISIASHQLRTPLTVIRGYLSMLQEGTIGTCDEQALHHIDKVVKSTVRLVGLVNDLLDVSRIERGTVAFDMKPMRLEDLARDVFEEFANEAKQKGIEFTYSGPRLATPKIPIDADKLRQTMINLIDNAIKYTEKGKVEVSVKRAGPEVRFLVRDTGIGLSEETRLNLFQKFTRGENIALLNTEGLGLGLYVAKQIVEHHNGAIWAESPGKGKGSTFVFGLRIPRK